MRRTTRIPIWLLVPMALLAGCQGGTGPSGTGKLSRGEKLAPAVEALQARSGALPLVERLSGVVKARHQVAIRPEINAPVIEVLVRSGEAVKRGQPLVRLSAETPRQQHRQAEASLRLSEASAAEARARVAELQAQVTRTRELAKNELVSDLELETREAQLAAVQASADQASARVEQARATVDERQAAINKTLVRSPVDGRVGQRNAEVGMLAETGSVLFVVGNFDQLRVEIPLTEAMMSYVQPGMTAHIHAESLAEPLTAILARISPFLESGSFSTVGEIEVENLEGQLRPGMFVTVDVLYGESEQATLVPSSALWEDPGTQQQGIYVVDMGSSGPESSPEDAGLSGEALNVEFRPVEMLAEGRGTAGIRGAEAGEWVVTVGQHLLHGQSASTARVRPTTWRRVLELQGLQREDLLSGFLEKQQRIARDRGAEPPSSREFLKGP